MDGFGREEDMVVVGRGCEEGYTEEVDRPEGLLCAQGRRGVIVC
jgi:hypothetical protein